MRSMVNVQFNSLCGEQIVPVLGNNVSFIREGERTFVKFSNREAAQKCIKVQPSRNTTRLLMEEETVQKVGLPRRTRFVFADASDRGVGCFELVQHSTVDTGEREWLPLPGVVVY